MDENALAEALDEARTIAEDAAALVLSGFRTKLDIRRKGHVDLVTDYDLRSEELIRNRLARAFPSHTIVGEEAGRTEQGQLVWYVDPIDGTTNYAHGHPFFAVSIGLYDGADPLVGVVIAPALGLSWSGARGLGARRNGEPMAVSQKTSLGEALCATGFPYDIQTRDDNNVVEYAHFLKRTLGIRRCGSAAIDLTMVADGTFDVYWEQGLGAWDMAAGALLVREAGGTITDYDGAVADPRQGRLVATNGALHGQVLETLAEARKGR